MPLATELKLLNSKDTTKFELPIIRILRVWLITLIDIDSGGKITENIFYKNRKLSIIINRNEIIWHIQKWLVDT